MPQKKEGRNAHYRKVLLTYSFLLKKEVPVASKGTPTTVSAGVR